MTFIDVITHLFLPHESNNHKARLLHPQLYFFYIVFLLFFGFGLRFVNKYVPNILGIATNISVVDLLKDTNQKRVAAGLPMLNLNSQLSEAASAKASDMFKNNYWAHFGSNGSSPWTFITNSGYRYSFAGENLAKDFNNSSSVVEAWMASPSHKSNILKPEYQDIGFAVVNGTLNGQETTLVVQMFGTSPGSSVAVGNLETNEVSQINSANPLKTQSAETIIPNPTSIPTPIIYLAGIKKMPYIDIPSLNKAVSLLLLGLLTIVLTLDGLLIWQRKTIRVSGHNIAHLIFLAGIIMVVWLTGRGSIL